MAKIEEHGRWQAHEALRAPKRSHARLRTRQSAIPWQYREVGQPVIVPGDMGRYSFLLVGTQTAMEATWGSTCHGAGRVMSRHEAIKKMRGKDVQEELAQAGNPCKGKGPGHALGGSFVCLQRRGGCRSRLRRRGHRKGGRPDASSGSREGIKANNIQLNSFSGRYFLSETLN